MAYNPAEKRDKSGKWTSNGPHTNEMHQKVRKAVNKAVGHKGGTTRRPYGSNNPRLKMKDMTPELRAHAKAQAKKGKGFYYRVVK